MPRTTGDSSRVGRSVAMPAASTTSTRRALGDVSNKNDSKDSESNNATKQTRRRSRRISEAATLDSHPVEDPIAAPRKQPRRSCTTTKISARHDPCCERNTESSQGELEGGKVAGVQTDSRLQKTVTAKPRAKRSRKSDLIDTEPPRKTARQTRTVTVEKKVRKATKSLSVTTNPCRDILSTADHGLRRDPFDASKFISGISIYDQENEGDAQEAIHYVTDIFQRLYNSEADTHPRMYMENQLQLNPQMRSILIDWLIEVHMKFRLLPETLYLCVNIIDRYLSRVDVERKRLQLVGVTALLIACKYEEIYPPEVKDCVYITDRAYTRQDVLDMEAHIVKTLKFQLTVPTGYPFLQRFLNVCKATKVVRNLSSFYMERMLQEYNSLRYRPSMLAAAAVSLAINNPDALDSEVCDSNQPKGVPPLLIKYTGFNVEDIKEAASLIASKVGECDITYSRRNLVAVKRKYESDRYDNVSTSFTLPSVGHLDSP